MDRVNHFRERGCGEVYARPEVPLEVKMIVMTASLPPRVSMYPGGPNSLACLVSNGRGSWNAWRVNGCSSLAEAPLMLEGLGSGYSWGDGGQSWSLLSLARPRLQHMKVLLRCKFPMGIACVDIDTVWQKVHP